MEWIKSLSEISREIAEEQEILAQHVQLSDDAITFNISYEYVINLDRVDTPEKILRWVVHLADKPWIDKRHLQRFMHLACKAHGIQIDMP